MAQQRKRDAKGRFATTGGRSGVDSPRPAAGNVPRRGPQEMDGYRAHRDQSESLRNQLAKMNTAIAGRRLTHTDPVKYLRELAQRKGRLSGAVGDAARGSSGDPVARRRTVARFGPVDWAR